MKEQTKLKLFQGPLKHIPDFEYSSNKNILKILYLCTVNYFTPISALFFSILKEKNILLSKFFQRAILHAPKPKKQHPYENPLQIFLNKQCSSTPKGSILYKPNIRT